MKVPYRRFTSEEHHTWKLLFERQTENREREIVDLFSRGINELGFSPERIPDINEVNEILAKKTGFKAVPVQGFEEAASFYEMLSRREYPIGFFIRDPKDLHYTPAPDVFHDLYGHMPFFVDEAYSDFCEDIGRRTMKYARFPELMRQFERLFWFTIEFALLKTPQGKRIFGAGIASSIGECSFALSDEPTVLPFDLNAIRNREFKIDEFQKTLFLVESEKQLYGCLDEFEDGCKQAARRRS